MFVCAVLVGACLLTLGWAAEIVGWVVGEGDMVGFCFCGEEEEEEEDERGSGFGDGGWEMEGMRE